MGIDETVDLTALTRESRDIWNQNAEVWDRTMSGEGNAFQQYLVGPTVERLLELQPGQTILDIACGNGVFSRRLAQLGARVVACDFSDRLIELARARTTEHADRIEYGVVDATDQAQLLALGEGRFDAIVCNMAMMDMPTIEPLVSSVPKLLKNGGRFVFSIMHPCFNGFGIGKVAEAEDRDGRIIETFSVKVSRYLSGGREKGLAVIGQPVPQYYWHRPLSVLLNTCFEAGLVLDRLEEPAFPQDMQAGNWFGWANYKEIPAVLVARLRVLPGV